MNSKMSFRLHCNGKININYVLNKFFLPTPKGNIWLFSCKTLHQVHQLVANFVCLLFGAQQVVFCVFSELSLKTAACCGS